LLPLAEALAQEFVPVKITGAVLARQSIGADRLSYSWRS
jgi:hypothetical protein